MLSAAPRICAASSAGRSRGGLGSRTRLPARPGGSSPNPTRMSSRSAMARTVAVVARLKLSVGVSACAMEMPALSHQGRVDPGLRQFGAKAALIVFGYRRPLHLVALVEEGEAEAEGDIAENARVFGPGHHGARRHHGRDVAVDEPGPGQIGERDHRADDAPALL